MKENFIMYWGNKISQLVIVLITVSCSSSESGDQNHVVFSKLINRGKIETKSRLKVDSLNIKQTEFEIPQCYATYKISNLSDSTLFLVENFPESIVDFGDTADPFLDVSMFYLDGYKNKNRSIPMSFPPILLTDSAQNYDLEIKKYLGSNGLKYFKKNGYKVAEVLPKESYWIKNIFNFSEPDFSILYAESAKIKFGFNFRYFVEEDTTLRTVNSFVKCLSIK